MRRVPSIPRWKTRAWRDDAQPQRPRKHGPQWAEEVNSALNDDRINIAVDLPGVLHGGQVGFEASAEIFAEAYIRGVAQGWERGPELSGRCRGSATTPTWAI